MTACFWAVLEEQTEARARLEASGEEPILMSVVLAGFQSPLTGRNGDERLPSATPSISPTAGPATEVPWMMRLAKVFVDPLNLKIITALNLETMSPSQLAARFESPSVFSIDRRCKLLTELGWIFKVGEKTGGERRGATENFYRAAGPAVFDGDDWHGLSAAARKGASATTFQQGWEKITEALAAGTFDARADRHLTWGSLLVDRQGWDRVIGLLDDYFDELLTLSNEKSLAPTRDGGLMGTFLLAGFESPQAAAPEHLSVF
jgi:hypothetical protein